MVHESRNADTPDSPKAGEPMIIHAYFKHTNQGLKLDWEMFAQTKYRTLHDFIHHPQPGKSGVFRVFITEVTSPAQLKDQTRMYLVSDPAYASDRARASVRIGSSTENDLAPIHWHGPDSQRPITRTATLELKWQATKHGPELVIDRLICWEFLGLGGQDKSKPSK